MTNTTYAIDDEFGNQITTGLSASVARTTAQSLANERGEMVALYVVGDEHYEIVRPATLDPEAQCREHGCSRWRCDEAH